MKMYVYIWENQFLYYWTESVLLFCGTASPCLRMHVCAIGRVDTFQKMHAQKALGRRALANKLHFMQQVVVFCATSDIPKRK